MQSLQTHELEQVYDDLAQAIDQVPPGTNELFLAKLTMLLANELANPQRLTELIGQAHQNLKSS